MSTRESNPILKPTAKLVIGLAALVMVGTALLLLPWSTTRPLSFSEAMFTAVSALTVTGLSTITPGQDLTRVGQVFLLILLEVGGVGYMVLAITTFRLLGRRIALADRLALRDSLGLISVGGILELTRYVVRTVFLIQAVGALLLYLHWRPTFPEGSALFLGIFHSASSFCNAGFDLFALHPEHFEGVPRDNITLVITGSLIFLGGLGIPVLFDIVTWPKRRQFSLHSRITVPLVLTLVVGGGIAFLLSERHGILAGESTLDATVMSFFQSISSRTAGFSGVPDFEHIAPATKVAIGSLMFIGCAPASMGGGITTGTLATLMLALWAYSRGRVTPVFKGRAIQGESVRKAAAVLTISVVLVVLSTWLIALTHKAPLDVVGFEVVSAFATCGLTLGLTSDLNLFGQTIIMMMMFWGRLGALTILVTVAKPRRIRRVHYPEERVLIG